MYGLAEQSRPAAASLRSTSTAGDLAALLELAPDAMVVVDVAWQILAVNEPAIALFGYSRNQLVGHDVATLVPGRLRRRHLVYRERYALHTLRREPGQGADLFGRRRDGSEFLVELSMRSLHLNDRHVMVASIRDVSARRQAEMDASHLAAVVESSHDAIIGKDLKGRIISWNQGAQYLFGYTAREAIGRSIAMLMPVGSVDELPELLARVRSGERVEDYQTQRARFDGTTVDVCLSVSPILGRDGSVVGVSTIARDVSGQLRYQKQLQYIAEHDPLTGMRNRSRFERDVAEQVERAHVYGERAALLVINVDDFKHINDRLGHQAGDDALRDIAAVISDELSAVQLAGRMGGAEFAVLVPYADLNRAQRLAGTITDAVESLPAPGGDAELAFALSIGITLVTADFTSGDEVFAAADRAMLARRAMRAEPA